MKVDSRSLRHPVQRSFNSSEIVQWSNRLRKSGPLGKRVGFHGREKYFEKEGVKNVECYWRVTKGWVMSTEQSKTGVTDCLPRSSLTSYFFFIRDDFSGLLSHLTCHGVAVLTHSPDSLF